jgi:hypothetical protein
MTEVEPKPLPDGTDASVFQARIESLLRAEDSHAALVAFVCVLFADGFDEGQALGVLETTRSRLRVEEREADEDTVMDVIDRLVGWCSPHSVLRRDSDPAG